MKHKIGITIGDINGVGPEIALKAVSNIDFSTSVPIVLSPGYILDFYKSRLSLDVKLNDISSIDEAKPEVLNILEFENLSPEINIGSIAQESGLISMLSIEKAINLCSAGRLAAMVTLPISKESIQKAGYKIPGHTEFLAEKTNTDT